MSQLLSQETVLSESVLRDYDRENAEAATSGATASFDPRVFGLAAPLTVMDVTGEDIEEYSQSPPQGLPPVQEDRHAAHAKKGIPRPVIVTRRTGGDWFSVPTMKAAADLLNTSSSTVAKVLDGKLYVDFWYEGGYVTISAARRRGDGVVPLVLVPAKPPSRNRPRHSGALRATSRRYPGL